MFKWLTKGVPNAVTFSILDFLDFGEARAFAIFCEIVNWFSPERYSRKDDGFRVDADVEIDPLMEWAHLDDIENEGVIDFSSEQGLNFTPNLLYLYLIARLIRPRYRDVFHRVLAYGRAHPDNDVMRAVFFSPSIFDSFCHNCGLMINDIQKLNLVERHMTVIHRKCHIIMERKACFMESLRKHEGLRGGGSDEGIFEGGDEIDPESLKGLEGIRLPSFVYCEKCCIRVPEHERHVELDDDLFWEEQGSSRAGFPRVHNCIIPRDLLDANTQESLWLLSQDYPILLALSRPGLQYMNWNPQPIRGTLSDTKKRVLSIVESYNTEETDIMDTLAALEYVAKDPYQIGPPKIFCHGGLCLLPGHHRILSNLHITLRKNLLKNIYGNLSKIIAQLLGMPFACNYACQILSHCNKLVLNGEGDRLMRSSAMHIIKDLDMIQHGRRPFPPYGMEKDMEFADLFAVTTSGGHRVFNPYIFTDVTHPTPVYEIINALGRVIKVLTRVKALVDTPRFGNAVTATEKYLFTYEVIDETSLVRDYLTLMEALLGVNVISDEFTGCSLDMYPIKRRKEKAPTVDEARRHIYLGDAYDYEKMQNLFGYYCKRKPHQVPKSLLITNSAWRKALYIDQEEELAQLRNQVSSDISSRRDDYYIRSQLYNPEMDE